MVKPSQLLRFATFGVLSNLWGVGFWLGGCLLGCTCAEQGPSYDMLQCLSSILREGEIDCSNDFSKQQFSTVSGCTEASLAGAMCCHLSC